MAKIENHRYSVQEAFSDSFFVIPDYQREYVWEDKEVNKLLQDISDEYDATRNEEYFIGTILVSDSENNTLEVIDGQQRLTTLFLILCALKQLLGDKADFDDLIRKRRTGTDGTSNINFRLDLRYEGAEDFCRHVSVAPSYADLKAKIESERGKLYGSVENLVNAYQSIILFFRDRYSEHDILDEQKLLGFWGYFANYVVFIQIKTSVGRALKIFETINERGVGLDSMDLLKNLLFTHVKQDRFTSLKNEWKKITEPLAKNKENPLRFLRYFLMANYPVKGVGEKKEPVIREDQIYDWLTLKENAVLCGYKDDPFQFVRKLTEGVTCFLNFSDGKDRNGDDSLALNNLGKLCGGAFSLHFILLLAASRLPEELFNYLVQQLETFLFYFIVTKSTTRDLERDFSLWADNLREIAAEKNTETQKAKLRTFVDEKFTKRIAEKSQEFDDYLKRFNFDSLQQYRIRYILAKLTAFADMAYLGTKTPISLDNYLKLEIEHILPATPEQELRQSFENENPDISYDAAKVRLGNLTLLEKPINIVAGRKYFEDKKPLYEKCGHYLTRSIVKKAEIGKNTSIDRLNNFLLSFDSWGTEQIEQRQAMLGALIKEVWTVQVI